MDDRNFCEELKKALESSGDLKGAIEDYTEKLKLAPADGRALCGRADVKSTMGDICIQIHASASAHIWAFFCVYFRGRDGVHICASHSTDAITQIQTNQTSTKICAHLNRSAVTCAALRKAA